MEDKPRVMRKMSEKLSVCLAEVMKERKKNGDAAHFSFTTAVVKSLKRSRWEAIAVRFFEKHAAPQFFMSQTELSNDIMKLKKKKKKVILILFS